MAGIRKNGAEGRFGIVNIGEVDLWKLLKIGTALAFLVAGAYTGATRYGIGRGPDYAVAQHFTDVQDRIQSAEAATAAVGDRVDEIEDQVDEIKADVAQIKQDIAVQAQASRGMEKKVDTLSQDIREDRKATGGKLDKMNDTLIEILQRLK